LARKSRILRRLHFPSVCPRCIEANASKKRP
jgi:hypothetical protein